VSSKLVFMFAWHFHWSVTSVMRALTSAYPTLQTTQLFPITHSKWILHSW